VALILGSTPNASGLAMLDFEKNNMLDEQVSVVFKKAKRVSFVILVVRTACCCWFEVDMHVLVTPKLRPQCGPMSMQI
jgi:hypothetical protein